MSITLDQNKTLPSKKNIDVVSNWLVVFAHSPAKTLKEKAAFPYQENLLSRRQQLDLKKADTSPIVIDLPNQHSSHVAFASIETTINSFDLLTLARKMLAAHTAINPTQIGIIVSGFNEQEAERIAEALISA